VKPVGAGTGSPHHDIDAVPREARAFQGLHAGIVTRTVANAVDFAVVVCVLVAGYASWFAARFLIHPAQFSAPRPPYGAVLLAGGVVLLGYFTASWATTGRTYGDHLLGLRVVDSRGERMRWRLAVTRAALCVVFPLGLFWSVVSSTRRSVQDILLRTSVVYDWASGVPVTASAAPTADRTFVRPRTPPVTGVDEAPLSSSSRSSAPGEGAAGPAT
jgi:uncharacterized RDD family membrane protein YckC